MYAIHKCIRVALVVALAVALAVALVVAQERQDGDRRDGSRGESNSNVTYS